MNAGGSLDIAQRIAGHSQPFTTKIYDRSRDRLTIKEIERVSFENPARQVEGKLRGREQHKRENYEEHGAEG